MVTKVVAYRADDQVDPSSLKTEDYFTARLSVARAQEYPGDNGRSVYALKFASSEADRVLPERLEYSFTDNDGSFKGRMGVILARQLRGRNVIAFFRRSDKGIVAIIPSNEAL
jgi:hypothetical protein